MSSNEDRIEKQNEERDRIETSKEEAIKDRDWLKTILFLFITVAAGCFALICIVGTYVIIVDGRPALHSVISANDTTTREVPKVIGNVGGLVENVNNQANRIGPTMDKLGNLADSLTDGPVAASTRSINQSTLLQVLLGQKLQNGAIRANEAADNANKTILAATTSVGRLGDFTLHTDDSFNKQTTNLDGSKGPGLIPAAVVSIQAVKTVMDKTGLTTDEATSAIHLTSTKLGISEDQINKYITDKRWSTILDNIVSTSGYTANTAKSISQFSKITIVSTIISRFLAAVVPGLL